MSEIEQTDRVKELEARVHALEIEKRISKIHTGNSKFKYENQTLDFLDGYAKALEEMPTKPISEPKSHAIAENIPKNQAKIGKPLGEVIDEDELLMEGSDL
jgi:hypothetical protein